MNAAEIISELKKLGQESTKNVLLKHGAKEPFFGVKIEELKKIQKKIKQNHDLALELFDSGISEARYLAALISEPEKMTKSDLNKWAKEANWSMLSEYAVAWTAAESRYSPAIALEWIDSKKENIATTGWSTLSSYLSIAKDEDIDKELFRKLMQRVVKEIHNSPNRVRYTMNAFLIAAGSFVPDLTKDALDAAKAIGKVEVMMGDTACKVPDISSYIKKVKDKGCIGKKKKTAFC